MTKKKTAASVKPIPRDTPILKGTAQVSLSQNLKAWLETREPKTVTVLSKKSGVSKKTIYNMQNAVYDPCRKTEAVAQAYGKEAWMLLCPLSLSELAEILYVYSRANDQDKKDIQFVVDLVRNRIQGRI